MASLDTAIRLVTQAVHQDTAKNFEEAARCYREAILVFKTIARSNSVTQNVRRAIHEKCDLYEGRLRYLERHLFYKADLTQLFRNCVPRELATGSDRRAYHRHSQSVSRSSSVLSVCDLQSPSVHGDEDLKRNPFLREGLSSIERGKNEDLKTHFPEALYFYEQGAGLLLHALRKGKAKTPNQAQAVRTKCLVLHERCDIIRQHLECGDPISLLRHPTQSLDSFLGGTPVCESPIPRFEEDQVLLMEEVHSMAGSTHSLYPTCVEIKRSPSVISGHSDVALSSNPHLVIFENEEMEHKPLIPLADLKDELQLSALSIHSNSKAMAGGPLSDKQRSYNSSTHCSLDNIFSSCSVSPSLRSASSSGRASCIELSRETEHLLRAGDDDDDDDGDDDDTDFPAFSVERDRNISELTCMNAELNLNENVIKAFSDSGSDSGYSDPRPDSATMQAKSPTLYLGGKQSPALDRQSPLSDIDSLDIVPSLPLATPSPEPVQSKSSSPTPSSGSRRSWRSRDSRGSGSSIRLPKGEEKVTVLSEETVVEGRLMAPKNEVYAKARPANVREEFVPTRAMAHQYQDQDDTVNKGCYYLVACLDSFWVL
ncbi:hypothetical protein TCAL_16714 [Tigriopus californicus]|uniref:MIT domain-containing protein n=1 Tax=Tigriopus californicus TaxID=6832 RepID=A0A553PLV8_TIGCA|nr:uncharacterized protein LOC131889855 [Tigriopus californicus]XP_059095047.1 uncharacterized protein LOC131889855 [Tigriopus californicus]TRY78656.1 hypothetical protein TCAL_16714 [Tigriopus californicus]